MTYKQLMENLNKLIKQFSKGDIFLKPDFDEDDEEQLQRKLLMDMN